MSDECRLKTLFMQVEKVFAEKKESGERYSNRKPLHLHRQVRGAEICWQKRRSEN